MELSGDGKVGRDVCLKGGIASFRGKSCVVIATNKGHSPTDMQNANYGMPSPHGYRTALRLMKLAEKFNLPVVTFVDTVGAWPTFQCERGMLCMHTSRRKRGGNEEIERGLSHTRTFVKCIHTRAGITNFLNTTS